MARGHFTDFLGLLSAVKRSLIQVVMDCRNYIPRFIRYDCCIRRLVLGALLVIVPLEERLLSL